MYHQLATRFGRNAHQISGREPLDNEALYRHVPSIFAREAHDSRSERYVYVPTIDIVEGLRREGWFPFFAVQSVPRDGSRHGHAKHMLRLRRDGGIGKPEAAEVIIVNSHDGISAYQMFAGMLRFVCTNSMIAGERFEEIRVPHKAGIQDQIIEGVFTLAEDFPRLIDASETMKEIRMSADEQRVLAEAIRTISLPVSSTRLFCTPSITTAVRISGRPRADAISPRLARWSKFIVLSPA